MTRYAIWRVVNVSTGETEPEPRGYVEAVDNAEAGRVACALDMIRNFETFRAVPADA